MGSRLPEQPSSQPLRHRRRTFGLIEAASVATSFWCRSGFSRDLRVTENQGLEVAGAAFIATLAPPKTDVQGESPSSRSPLFVGAALAATSASSRTRDSGLPEQPSPRPFCHRSGKFGAKAPPTEAHFCRSGFRRDLSVTENHGLGIAGAAFIATLAPSKTDVRAYRSGFSRDPSARFEEQKENGVVRLRLEALRRYRTADEAFMRRSPGEGASSWRERLDEQVRRMARAVWSGSLYTPFRMEA